MCQAGARWVQRELLESNPSADVRVYAVWFAMLGGDARSTWDAVLLPDSRVRHYWDDAPLLMLSSGVTVYDERETLRSALLAFVAP